MLKILSLRTLIFGGFGLVLIFLLALAATSLRGTNTISNDFTEYRQTARESLLINAANEALLRARLGVMQYRIDNSQERVDVVLTALDDLYTIKDDFRALDEDSARTAQFSELNALVDSYQTAFTQVVGLQDQRNVLVPELNAAGRDARSALSAIMESAYNDADAEAAYYGGLVQQHAMLARYYAEKFLLHNHADDQERTLSEIALANDSAQTLQALLQDPGRRALLATYGEQWELFADRFGQLTETIAERNELKDNQLDAIGPQLASGYAEALLAVTNAQNTIGPRAATRINNTTGMMWIISAVALVLGGISALLVGRLIAGSIAGIVARMKDLAEGKLDIHIQGGDRKDELGDMARALVVFKDNAHEKVRLEAEQAELALSMEQEKRQAMQELADSFEMSVNEVVGAVSSASELMVSLAEKMSNSAGRAGERSIAVAAASEEASTNVETVAAASEEMSNSIAEVSQRIGQTATMTDEAARGADSTTHAVSKLATSAQTVGEVISLISAIAEQTNLLALNATIEAARAGEAGKGFAVVASEVKNLANQTAKATEQISAQIMGMQGETDAVVESIDKIGTMIQELNSTSSSIAAAVEEQHSATQEITRNTQQAADGTREVSSNITEISTAVQETGQAASEVLSASSQLANDAGRLRESVANFLKTVRAA